MKLVPEIVAGLMSSLKVAVIAELLGTVAAFGAGTVNVTVGGVVSTTLAVTKLHTKSVESENPDVSRIAVVSVATHCVLAGSAAAGTSVAARVAAS